MNEPHKLGVLVLLLIPNATAPPRKDSELVRNVADPRGLRL